MADLQLGISSYSRKCFDNTNGTKVELLEMINERRLRRVAVSECLVESWLEKGFQDEQQAEALAGSVRTL